MYSSTKGKDAAAASAVSAADVLGLYYSLSQPYRDGASWVMRGSTEGAIRTLAGNNFSFGNTPSAQVGAVGLNTLVGNNRVFNSDEIVALSTSTKSILFGNFNFYTIVQRRGIQIRRLTERFAEVGQVGFLASERVGGVITQAEAFMHLLNPSA
jgi:HK97 family phage major capsid protein